MIVSEKNKIGRNDPCVCGSGKKYKKCCSGLSSGIENPSFDIPLAIQEAVRNHKAGDLEAAEVIYRRVLLLEKNNADALHLLGEIAYQRKNYESAVDLIQQAVNINQTSPVVYTNLGNALRETGKYDAAIDAFIRAIELEEDHFSAYLNFAVTLKKISQFEKRGKHYMRKGISLRAFSIKQRYGILDVLGYWPESSRAWNQMIFEECVIPVIDQGLKNREYLFASTINNLTTHTIAQQPHTSEQWRLCHDKTNALFVTAGEKIRHTMPPLVLPSDLGKIPLIGFIIDQSVATGSGGVVLFNLLTGLSRLNPKTLVPIVYAIDQIPEESRRLCQKMGIRVVDTFTQGDLLSSEDALLQRLKALRQQIQEDKVSAVIYAGTYEAFPCFAASMGLAPLQIYFSVGFCSLSVPAIDGYIANSYIDPDVLLKSENTCTGLRWRTIPSCMQDPYPESGTKEATEIEKETRRLRQDRFSAYDVILGSIGRPQKIESIHFIDTLARILHANPKAVYLWFGHHELSSVRNMMEDRGISERCLFQGWVDVKPYWKLLDIHLDSFPFASGLSMHETMSVGTASVWMKYDGRGSVGSVTSDIMSLIGGQEGSRTEQEEVRKIFLHPETGETLALLADSPDQYVAYAQRLIDDAVFLKAVGKAGQEFMRGFRHDPRIAGEVLAGHLLDIIDESRCTPGVEISKEEVVTDDFS